MSHDLYKGRYRVSSARLPGHDYSSPGKYFVTLCLSPRRPLFGEVFDRQMRLSPAGRIADSQWRYLGRIYDSIKLHAHQIMPDHMHGILEILPSVSDTDTTLGEEKASSVFSAISPEAGSLSAIIRTYKSSCTKIIRKRLGLEFSWQARFHDRVIRSEEQFQAISEYIWENPKHWGPK